MSIEALCIGMAVVEAIASAAEYAAADSFRGLPRDSTDACATARGVPAAAECGSVLDRSQATGHCDTGHMFAGDLFMRIGWCFGGKPNVNFHRSGQSSPHDLVVFLNAEFAGT